MKLILTESQFNSIFEDDIKPSDRAIKNICDSEKFCKAQGKITFGQLRSLVDFATKKRILTHLGEGGYKAFLRILPWFLPQITFVGVAASITRAINKIIKPALEETDGYKTWWGKVIMRSFNIAEGDLPIDDPLSKIFFISDGLMTMLNDKYKVKFARYIAEIASEMPDDEPVPEFFVENELRNWVNDKFLLDPPLPPKTSPNQNLDLGDQETLKEQKSDKREMFQEMINEKLDYIRKGCNDLSHDLWV